MILSEVIDSICNEKLSDPNSRGIYRYSDLSANPLPCTDAPLEDRLPPSSRSPAVDTQPLHRLLFASATVSCVCQHWPQVYWTPHCSLSGRLQRRSSCIEGPSIWLLNQIKKDQVCLHLCLRSLLRSLSSGWCHLRWRAGRETLWRKNRMRDLRRSLDYQSRSRCGRNSLLRNF